MDFALQGITLLVILIDHEHASVLIVPAKGRLDTDDRTVYTPTEERLALRSIEHVYKALHREKEWVVLRLKASKALW